MTAGLPGTGLGGLYYLLSILVMCVKEGVHRIRGSGDRAKSKIAREQILILAGAIFTMWLNGLALQYLLRMFSSHRPGIEASQALAQAGLPLNSLAVGAGLLAGLMLLVQLLRLFVRRPRRCIPLQYG
jgi:hypothetical protein